MWVSDKGLRVLWKIWWRNVIINYLTTNEKRHYLSCTSSIDDWILLEKCKTFYIFFRYSSRYFNCHSCRTMTLKNTDNKSFTSFRGFLQQTVTFYQICRALLVSCTSFRTKTFQISTAFGVERVKILKIYSGANLMVRNDLKSFAKLRFSSVNYCRL